METSSVKRAKRRKEYATAKTTRLVNFWRGLHLTLCLRLITLDLGQLNTNLPVTKIFLSNIEENTRNSPEISFLSYSPVYKTEPNPPYELTLHFLLPLLRFLSKISLRIPLSLLSPLQFSRRFVSYYLSAKFSKYIDPIPKDS